MDDPKIEVTDADLRLLLAEADREDRLLLAARDATLAEPRETFDQQILGGLVSP